MLNIVVGTSLNFEIESLASFRPTMKNVTSLLNSPNVMQKIESNPIIQLDNPITSKPKSNLNNTKNIPKKRLKPRIHCLPDMLSNLKKSSVEYQKIASRRYTSIFYFLI